MFLLGNRNKFQYLWVPMAITIGVYLVFEKVLVFRSPTDCLTSSSRDEDSEGGVPYGGIHERQL